MRAERRVWERVLVAARRGWDLMWVRLAAVVWVDLRPRYYRDGQTPGVRVPAEARALVVMAA